MAIVNGVTDNLDKLIDVAFQIIQFLIDELTKGDNLQIILGAAIAETDWLSLGADILKGIDTGLVDGLGFN